MRIDYRRSDKTNISVSSIYPQQFSELCRSAVIFTSTVETELLSDNTTSSGFSETAKRGYFHSAIMAFSGSVMKRSDKKKSETINSTSELSISYTQIW